MTISYLKSETIKFFSYPQTILGIVIASCSPAILLFFALHSATESQWTISLVLGILLKCLFLGQVGIVIAMASYTGDEYTHSAIRNTLLCQPSRLKNLWIREGLIFFFSIGIAIVSSMLCLLILRLIPHFSDFFTFSFVETYFRHVMPAFLSWAGLGIISANLAIVTKSTTISMAILSSLILGLSQMVFTFTKFAIYLPDLAGMNLFQETVQKSFLSIQTGLLVQFGWSILICILSSILFEKRDSG